MTAASRKKRSGSARAPSAGRPVAPAVDGASGLRRKLKEAARAQASERWVLKLYVTGTTPASQRAIARVREICEKHLLGRYQLEVVDIYQLPTLAKDDQIIAAPTLIKVLPAPLRRFIGDMTKAERVLFGLDVRKAR
jgi:circadian clock protein KaiB